MKQIWLSIVCLLALITAGCSNSELYDNMPREIQNFVAQYYPNSTLASFSSTNAGYIVIIKNGPTMMFDTDCQWTKIDGDGSTLPSNFLYNNLPATLYDYLEETENTTQVFGVTRNSKEYVVSLLKDTLTYDIETEKITGKNPEQDN